MYLPQHFKSDDPGIAAELIGDYPFASLISVDDGGLPFVTHLPLHLECRDGGFVLWGHCARGNPHAKYLAARPRAVATFLGPHAYLSPSVYPDLARVPTWNYLAVHCTVEARLVDDPDEKDALLKRLIGDHEPAYARQWRDLGEDFAGRMLGGIIGMELKVTEWQCKLKANQHRPEARETTRAAYAAGNEHQRALAEWMDRLSAGK